MKVFGFAIISLFVLPWLVSAQHESLLLNEDFITDAQQAIDSVYNLNYEASVLILQPWREKHPDHPLWAFWPALDIWWKILPDLENIEHDQAFFDALDEAARLSKERMKETHDIDALIIKSMCYGFSARHLSNRGSWYQSLRRARTAMAYFSDLEQLLPELGDIQFGLGMSRYFSAFFRESYPVIRPFAWLLPRGDRQDGLNRLNVAAGQSTFMIPEATFFLGHIHLHYERNFGKALEYLNELTRSYPNNGYYHRLLIRSHYRNSNRRTAMLLINRVLEQWEEKQSASDLALKEELLVLRGRMLMLRGGEDQALEDFAGAFRAGEKLKPGGNRRNFLIASYYLGEIYLHRGERETAEYFLKKVAASNLDFGYVSSAKSLMRREF